MSSRVGGAVSGTWMLGGKGRNIKKARVGGSVAEGGNRK